MERRNLKQTMKRVGGVDTNGASLGGWQLHTLKENTLSTGAGR